MKTLQQIRDEVAKERGFERWADMSKEAPFSFSENVTKRYMKEIIEETVEICAAHAEDGCFDKEGALANSMNLLI